MKQFWFAVLIWMISSTVWAFEPFTVKDIRVEGLQRISAGTVFNYLPIQVGDTLDTAGSRNAIRALFKTGFFKDVRLERDTGVVVVIVSERPSIASIDLSGNKDIESEDLLEGLKQIGLADGRVYNRSLLEKVKQELHRQYYSNGKYGVKIKTEATPLERNRVAVTIEISEGRVAKIQQINIVGNHVFEDDDLADEFQLSPPTMFSFYTSNDQYSKQKLSGDLETLKSYYQNRGYINFKIRSTQVTITPDKKSIYITINVEEGDQYRVSEIRVAGDLVVPVEILESLVKIGPGDIFSRKKIAESTRLINDVMGDDGYAFANINTVPDIDDEKKTVKMTFFIDPGKRVYVRRISMFGNTRTADVVMRREMRQMEGGWFSTKQVNRSRTRLEKLGYFTSVNVETPAVPGSNDKIDVNYTVVENPSGNFLASLGYSQTGGIILGFSINENNFLGTGKRVGLTFNNSDVSKVYRLSYSNPYHTIDGVSRGFFATYRETDAAQANLSRYTTDEAILGATYGIPLSEFSRIRAGFDVGRTTLNATSSSSTEVLDFIRDNGTEYSSIGLNLRWFYDTRNRALFADRGYTHRVTTELTSPGSDLEYFKIGYYHQRFIPLFKGWTVSMKGDLGYGDGYGDSDKLPFFKNYFAGGTRNVRGYKDNRLGPKDSQGNSIGGSLKVTGGLELLFPTPFTESESKSIQLSAFADGGNVFAGYEDFSAGELRYSVGLAAIWVSPLGPLKFSLAYPINDKAGDDTQVFQFSFGGNLF